MASVSEEPLSAIVENRGARVSIVIPARNEAKNLPYVLPHLPKWVHEVILVDGHSTDDTIEGAQTLLPQIKIIQQTGKGKGNALRCGLEACTGDIILMMDADGSTDPQEVPRFIEVLLEGADFAKGSRFIGDGGSVDITLLRKLGNRALSLLVNLLFRVHFTDLCYGYNAFWRDCLEYFEVDCDGFEVEAQIHLRLCKADVKIIEVPSFERSRIHGSSNLRALPDGWRVLRVILKEWVSGLSLFRTDRMQRSYQRENFVYDEQALTEQIDATQ